MGQHIRVLAINGDGNRGLIPATILHKISMKANKQIPELFDFIIGTSTGGILAAAYALPRTPYSTRRDQTKFNTRQVLNLLEDKLGYIFPPEQAKSGKDLLFEAKYTRNNLDSFLEEIYKVQGVELTLSHTLVPIVVTSQNAVSNSSQYWCSCSKRYSKYFLKDAIGATTTLPTYFPHKFTPVQNTTLADAQTCELWLIKGSTGKCQHKQFYGGLFANSPLALTVELFNEVRLNASQHKQKCSRYNIFANEPSNLTLQLTKSEPKSPAKLFLDQDIDLTIVTIGTGHFVGNEIPILDNLSTIRAFTLTAITFSSILFINSIFAVASALKAPTSEQCKFTAHAISTMLIGVGSLALSYYSYFSLIPKIETAEEGYAGLLRGDGLLHKGSLYKMIKMNERADSYTSRELFGSISFSLLFPNITQIPIDASDTASIYTITKTTQDYIEGNLTAFHNLTKCLMNTEKRIEECDYASQFFLDNFADPLIPSINGMRSKESAAHTSYDHLEL